MPDTLLELFFTEHMALSIKLLLLKAIDVLTNGEVGMAYVCRGNSNCYQALVKIALSNQVFMVRSLVSFVTISMLRQRTCLYAADENHDGGQGVAAKDSSLSVVAQAASNRFTVSGMITSSRVSQQWR